MPDTEDSAHPPEQWRGTPRPLFRPALGRRLAAVFLLFLALTIGNLIFIRILYDDIDEGIHVIDQAGRLRYLGQAVALQTAWAAERPGRDGAPLAKAIAEFEQTLAASEQAVRQLCPKILLEAPTVFPRLQALRRDWQSLRAAVEEVRRASAVPEAHRALEGIPPRTEAVLATSQAVVSALNAAIDKVHARADGQIAIAALLNLTLVLAAYVFVRRRIVRPVAELSSAARRFAAGDYGARARFSSRDELGELAAAFNETADQVGRLAGILEATPDFVETVDAKGRLIYLNRAARSFLGMGENEDVAAHRDAEHHPAWAIKVLEETGFPVASREGVWAGETALLAPNGWEIPVSQVIVAHRAQNGSGIYFSTIARDISERKQAEDHLRQLSSAVEQSPASVVITDIDGHIQFVNAAFVATTGYRMEEVLGKKPSLLKSGMTPPETYRAMWDTLLAGNIWRGELQNRKKSGELYWERTALAPIRNAAGEIASFVAVKEDTTERKRMEQQLRESEGRLAAILDNSPTPIYLKQPDGRYLLVNRHFASVFGISKGAVVGKTDFDIFSREQAELFRANDLRVLEARAPVRFEETARHDDGEDHAYLSIKFPLHGADGTPYAVCGISTDITERKRYEKQLEYLASHDVLTSLPNRNLLLDRLSQAIVSARRHRQMCAVVFLDLDHFKFINDSLGHHVGDKLLQAVTQRLADCVRQGDTVARQGGDEFILVLGELLREEDIAVITQKVLAAVARPFTIEKRELIITCSMGVSLYPRDGKNAQTLLKNADLAMYRAKEQGRNNVQYFTSEMNAKVLERLAMENSLRHALERGEMLLHYQPQVDVASGRIVGVEALLRWQRPEFGLVAPAQFIPLAEETGLILPLGEWVLRTACAQARAWQEAGLPPLTMAVNLSARQLRQRHFPDRVAQVLKETGLAAEWLELEITETLLMQNPEEAAAILRELKALGVDLAIDDFGTGYSSLGYLKRFPLDRLKVDRTFVRDITTDPDDAAIVRAVIAMAHQLKLWVVAEGVETAEQLAFLREQQCDEMQGYLFSRPLPQEEIEPLLRSAGR